MTTRLARLALTALAALALLLTGAASCEEEQPGTGTVPENPSSY
ncbi:MAG TPA: hypothetical protein VM367_04075 [Pseudonocardia sp.]|nr:hypothetical protein [Pseudonocardia sp.]